MFHPCNLLTLLALSSVTSPTTISALTRAVYQGTAAPGPSLGQEPQRPRRRIHGRPRGADGHRPSPDGGPAVFFGQRLNDLTQYAATRGDVGAASTAPLAPATRCSSRDAAALIRTSSGRDGLLVVTCDASGRGVRRGRRLSVSG